MKFDPLHVVICGGVGVLAGIASRAFTTNYGGIISVVGGIIVLIGTIATYSKKIIDKYNEEILWRKKIDEGFDRIERRLHWSDIGFEVLFESQRKLIQASSLSAEEKCAFDDALTKLIMKRVPTDNPHYRTSIELKEYLIAWALDHEAASKGQ